MRAVERKELEAKESLLRRLERQIGEAQSEEAKRSTRAKAARAAFEQAESRAGGEMGERNPAVVEAEKKLELANQRLNTARERLYKLQGEYEVEQATPTIAQKEARLPRPGGGGAAPQGSNGVPRGGGGVPPVSGGSGTPPRAPGGGGSVSAAPAEPVPGAKPAAPKQLEFDFEQQFGTKGRGRGGGGSAPAGNLFIILIQIASEDFRDFIRGGLGDPEARVRNYDTLRVTPADVRKAEELSERRKFDQEIKNLAQEQGISEEEMRRRLTEGARRDVGPPTIGPR